MPIKDRTRRRLVRLGVIRLGHKETSARGTQYPVQDDHFVLTDAPEIATIYGNEPRELDVLLPFPDIMRNFDAYYQVWASGVLLCQGDGEYVQYAAPVNVVTDEKGKARLRAGEGETLVNNGTACKPFSWNGAHFEAGETVPCPGADADAYPHCQFCKLSALLKVMMSRPELFRMGYYQIVTGSGRNYDTIMGTLEAMPADKLNGIPFKLRLVEEMTTYTENGKRHQTKKWFLQLEPDPEYTRELYARAAARQIGQGTVLEEMPQLEAGGDYDAEYIDMDYNGIEPTHTDSNTEEEPSTQFVPDFDSLDGWNAFRQLATEHLGFDDVDAVKGALKAIYQGHVQGVTYKDAWGDLITYKASEAAVPAPEVINVG